MGGLFGKPKKKVAGGVKIKGAPPSQQDYPAFKMLMIGDPAVRLDPTSMESAISSLFPTHILCSHDPRSREQENFSPFL